MNQMNSYISYMKSHFGLYIMGENEVWAKTFKTKMVEYWDVFTATVISLNKQQVVLTTGPSLPEKYIRGYGSVIRARFLASKPHPFSLKEKLP